MIFATSDLWTPEHSCSGQPHSPRVTVPDCIPRATRQKPLHERMYRGHVSEGRMLWAQHVGNASLWAQHSAVILGPSGRAQAAFLTCTEDSSPSRIYAGQQRLINPGGPLSCAIPRPKAPSVVERLEEKREAPQGCSVLESTPRADVLPPHQ